MKILMNPCTGSIDTEENWRADFDTRDRETWGSDTFEDADLIEMVGYRYTATFERLPDLVAEGVVWLEVDEPHTEDVALRAVYGICGNWRTATGHSFEAGCPTSVEIRAEKE